MPQFPESLTTEHILDMHVDLEPPQAVGQASFGTRSIYIVKGGTFEGPKLPSSGNIYNNIVVFADFGDVPRA